MTRESTIAVCVDLIRRTAVRAAGMGAAVEAAAGRAGVDGQALMRRRLAPDMFCLADQAVVLADGLAGALARAAGRDDPRGLKVFNRGFGMDLGPLPDGPAAMRRLLDSAARDTAAYADLVDPARVPREITLALGDDVRIFDSNILLAQYVLPNAEFHLSMIHAIARSAGLAIGKPDFEGPPLWREP